MLALRSVKSGNRYSFLTFPPPLDGPAVGDFFFCVYRKPSIAFGITDWKFQNADCV